MFAGSLIHGRGVRTAGGGGGAPAHDIPLEWGDARYTTNVAGPDLGPSNAMYTVPDPSTFTNMDWDEGPDMGGGPASASTPCLVNWAEGTGTISFIDSRVRWKEGLRLGAAAGVATVMNGCFLTGFGDVNGPGVEDDDHGDMIQNDGGAGPITLINTCLRPYSDAEAQSIVATATGSDAFRWGDNSTGAITFENVLVLGGGRGITINADSGTVTVSFENVYIVEEGGGFPNDTFYKLRFSQASGASLVITKWVNVCNATIVDGVIIPGTQISAPPAGDGLNRVYGSSDAWR